MPLKSRPTTMLSEEAEIDALRARLAEAEEALAAIRTGQVDALVVEGAAGTQVFSLAGAETVYRHLIETMGEGALTVTADGEILFCNARLGELLCTALEDLLGRELLQFVVPEEREHAAAIVRRCRTERVRERVVLCGSGAMRVPVLLQGHPLRGEHLTLCLVVADLRELEDTAHQMETLRQTHAKLGASEERFTKAFAHSAAIMSLIRLSDGVYLEVNEAWLATLGHRRERVLGRTARELGLLADEAQREMLLERIRRGDAIRDLELTVCTASGSARELCLSAGVISVGGEAVILTSAIDITQRKQAEAALRESEQRLRLAAQAARFGVHSWDATTDRSWWSADLYELLGVPTHATPTLATAIEGIHPEDRARIERAMRAALDPQGTGEFNEEFRIVRSDGEIRWVANRSRTEFEGEGAARRVLANVGIVLDITERKSYEERLAQSEAQARAQADELAVLYAGAPIGLCVLDRELRYVRINARMAEINGAPVEAHIGRTVREMVPDLAATAEQTLSRVLAGEPVLGVEFIGTTAAAPGVRRVWRENWLPIRGRQGEGIVGVMLSAEDVTEEKRHAESLKAADRQKDEFLAMLAHELRNPLAPIRHAGEILKCAAGTDARTSTALAVLIRQTEQLTRLVDDLLDVSRIAQGRITLARRPVEIATVIDQAVETVQPMLRAKSHRLAIERTGEPVYVDGDVTRLTQVLGNVLGNAAKYTEPGGQIRLEASASRSQVELRIIDNGCGISPQLLPHVFDLFVQSERTLDRSQGGLGIGLSVVKRLVEMHGGTVSASSAGPGTGTTVCIVLPRVAEPNGSERQPNLKPAVTRRVLVIDDNRDAADTLAMLLRLEGHTVETAYSAEKALQTAERLEPEFILLDIGLPHIDGFEVARRLRKIKSLRKTRIVAVTGYGQAQDRERALAAGFDAHLVKPARLEDLQRILAGDAATVKH